MAALQAEGEKVRERNAALSTLSSASSYLGAAQTIYRLSLQRPKPDLDRDAGFQERDWSRIRESLDRLQRSLDAAADRAFLRWATGLAAALPAGQRIELLDQAVGLRAGMFPPTPTAPSTPGWTAVLGDEIGDRDARLALVDKSAAELKSARRRLHRARGGARADGRVDPRHSEDPGRRLRPPAPALHAGAAGKGGRVGRADANSTLRVTYGQVKGVDAKDGLFYTRPPETIPEMRRAAEKLRERLAHAGERWVYLKGGHLPGGDATDLLFDGDRMLELTAPRIDTRNTHGTGCTLSAALSQRCCRNRPMSPPRRGGPRRTSAPRSPPPIGSASATATARSITSTRSGGNRGQSRNGEMGEIPISETAEIGSVPDFLTLQLAALPPLA